VAIAQLFLGFAWNWQNFVRGQLHLLIGEYPREIIALVTGLEISAMSHSISDWIASRRKQRLKNKLSKAEGEPKKSRQAKIYSKKK
jgi:uncharacterized metal-binding protein